VKAVLAVFMQFFRGDLRNQYTLFWNLAFPLLLMSILVLIFGNMDNVQSSIVFNIGYISPGNSRSVESEEASVSRHLQEILEQMAEQEDSWLRLHVASEQNALEDELDQLEMGNRHAVVVVPKTLDDDVNQAVRASLLPNGGSSDAGRVMIYSRPGDPVSEAAGDVLAQVISGLNTELNREMGLARNFSPVALEHKQVESHGETGTSFDFATYLMPGIILMVFLSSGLELVVERVSSYRERGILRRYFATPLSPSQYIFGLLFHIVLLSLVQVGLIYLVATFVFDVRVSLLQLSSVLYMIFSLATMLSLGFLITSVAKTANAASSLANGLIYPLMFLGGLYFPVLGLPFPISLLNQLNPVTYLVNGFRDVLGVFPSPTSTTMNVFIPALWMVASLALAFYRFSWTAEGRD